jgi:multidrug efflux pump subunit AcrA (membrane-fusion protein)
MKRPWITGVIAGVLLVGLAAVGGSRVAPAAAPIPTAAVQKGRVEIRVNAAGELRATRSTRFFVPAMGGQLTIVSLANSGTAVTAGDVIAEFDASEQEFALEQANFELRLADQEIAKAEAEALVVAADDDVALLAARFAVRRAELDARANELVGMLVAQQNLMLLEEARGKLSALEQEVHSHRETSTASAAMIHEKRIKAAAAVAVATRNIESLRVVAPFDGFVSVRQNMNALGGIVFFGASMPDFKPGDAANPGTLFAELIDTTRVEVTAKLAESDRANVAPGQPVDIRVDAAPGVLLQGKVRAVSSVASRQMFEAGGERRFDITFDVEGRHAQVRPGVSTALSIGGQVFENAVHVPRAAIFDVTGQPTVYVKTGGGFEPRAVKVLARTDAMAIIEALDVPAEVALVNPSRSTSAARPAAASPSPQPGR